MEEEEELESPEKLNNMMKSQMVQLEKDKHKLFKNQDHDEIIKKLYILSEKLKKKDFSETYYSQQFFSDLKIAIENSEKLYKENLKNNVNNFINDCDILFTKEIEKDKTEKKNENEDSLKKTVDINEKIQNKFENAKSNIKDIFLRGKDKILRYIDSEIQNKKQRLEESNKDIKSAIENLENKINEYVEEMKRSIEKEIS